MNRVKRVRFRDPEEERSESERSEAAFVNSNSPKTSEFAFFKKFREGASLKYISKSPHRGKHIQSKHSKGNSHCGEDLVGNQKIYSSSLFAENTRPHKIDAQLPQLVTLRRLEQGDKNPAISSLIKEKSNDEDLELSCHIKTPPSSVPDDFFLERATELVSTDTRYTDGDIFSMKRAKLQSLGAKIMVPSNIKILKGYDVNHVISFLFNRLLPKGSETIHSEPSKSWMDKRETDHQAFHIPNPAHQLKKNWSEGKLVENEAPYYMDAGVSTSWINEFNRLPVGSDWFPAIEFADCSLGHKDREIEAFYFSNMDYKHSWDNNKAEAIEEENGNCNSSCKAYKPRRMSLECEPFVGHFLDDTPSCSWHYRSDSSIQSAKKVYDTCTNYDNQFLLEYEKSKDKWFTDNIKAGSSDSLLSSTFEDSSGKCSRLLALTNLMESDQSNDDLVQFAGFGGKPSNLLLGRGFDRLNEKQSILNFPFTSEHMHPQHNAETTIDPDRSFLSSSFLPMASAHAPSYLDNALQRVDTRNSYVTTRSHNVFCTPTQLAPAENGFLFPLRRRCLIKETTPLRRYPPKETILCSASTSTAYLPFHDYHALHTPAVAYTSPYLLLEGSQYTCGQSSENQIED